MREVLLYLESKQMKQLPQQRTSGHSDACGFQDKDGRTNFVDFAGTNVFVAVDKTAAEKHLR